MTKKLFSNDYSGKTTKSNILSVEMIDPQKNDAVVPALENCFNELIDGVDKYKPNNTYKLFKNKAMKKVVDKIDLYLKDRFGITFKHTSGDGIGYAVFTAPPKNQNVLFKDIENVYDDTDKYLGLIGKSAENVKSVDKIDDLNADYNDLMFRWKKSMDSLEKTLNVNGVVIDRHKAKIRGLPKDYVVFLVADFVTLITELKFNAKELVAVMLHEVGHAFTHLEYSYKTLTNTSVLIDTIKENIENKNMSYKESLIISYRDVNGEDISDLSGKNDITVTLNVVEKYVKEHRGFNDSLYGSIDSEQLADQFSGRFGLGVELITSLDKLNEHYGNPYLSSDFLVTISSYTSLVFVYGLLGTASLAGAFFITIASIAILAGIIIFGTIFNSILTLGGIDQSKVYDDKKQRLKRVRYEIIRQIRLTNMDKEAIRAIITQLDNMDKIINKLPENDGGIFDNFMRKFTGRGRRLVELQTLEQLTENLMENDLHLASAKLKTL